MVLVNMPERKKTSTKSFINNEMFQYLPLSLRAQWAELVPWLHSDHKKCPAGRGSRVFGDDGS